MPSVDPAKVFALSNLIVFPAWLLLIVLPGWKWTRVVAAYGTPTLLGVGWIYILATQIAPPNAGFGTLDQLLSMATNPWLLTAGWIHALILDLFIGAWEVRDAQRLGIPHIYVVPCLVLTFLIGPVGLLAYFTVRVLVVRRWPWNTPG
jgi:hypothetical protein